MIKNSLFSLLALFISFSAISQLPNPAIVGYWESWNGSNFVELKNIDSRYNVIHIAFAELKTGKDYDIEYTPPAKYTEEEFKSEVAALQAEGKKVIISIGGQNDHVMLDSIAEKDTFVSSMNALVDYWGFDGIDIDLEGSSLQFSEINIQLPGDERQQLMITAIQEIMANHYTTHGKKLLLTMAPETIYVQGALSQWAGSFRGAYLPMIEALKDSIDMLNVQLYNSGSMYGLDGQAGGAFNQGSADFVVAMTEAVILGFESTGTIGTYNGISAAKVGVGLPGCHSSDAVPHKDIEAAIAYLTGKGPQPGSYTLKTPGGYPDLLGMMTWSINSDRKCSPSYGFIDTWGKIFTDSSYVEIDNNGDIYEQLENGKLLQINLFKDTYATHLDTASWTIENLPDGVTVDSLIRVNDTTAQVVLKGNALAKYPSAIFNVKITADSTQFTKSNLPLWRGNGTILKKTRTVIPGILECEDLSAAKNAYLVSNFFGNTSMVLRFNSNYYSEYEIDVAESGKYDVIFKVGLQEGSHSSTIKIDGITKGIQNMSSPTSWKSLDTTTSYTVSLDSGFHVLTLLMNSGWMNIDWMDFKKATSNGINSLEAQHSVLVYPNPANQVVNVKTQELSQIKILDLSGKTVQQPTSFSLEHRADITSLKKGMYLVHIQNENGDVVVRKLVKR